MFITEKDFTKISCHKIVCLVPSITELLYDLGLNDEVVGITKFCVHPKHWKRTKQQIGGTKNINIEKIKALQPDVIICSKEENVKEQLEALAKKYAVYLTDVQNYDDALLMIKNIGTITNRITKANEIIEKIKSSFEKINKPAQNEKAAYLIWKDPYMSIGADTYIHCMMHKIGLENVLANDNRYPTLTIQSLKELEPAIILLSSEPYPFAQKHIDELKAHFAETKIVLVDGEMFSWYGSRMLYAGDYFNKLLTEIRIG
jgi:ABC-type Fe3+-hydroxamate transport system substrate-binding protein